MSIQFETMFEHVAQAVVLVDVRTNRVVRANQHFAALLGRRLDELSTLSLHDLVDPVDLSDSKEEMARLQASAPSIETAWHYVRTDGTRVSSRTVAILVREKPDSDPLYVIVVDDLTQQEALEERLLLSSLVNGAVIEGTTHYREKMDELVRIRTIDLVRARDDAESASRAKSAFLATVSHELRTPLNAIIGFSSLLLESEHGCDAAEQRKQLSIIRTSGEQLLELIREILDLASIEAGRLALEIESVDLRSIIDEQVQFAQAQARERHLELRRTESSSSITVLADPRRLGQVIRNLLSNALKFTDHGHVAVHVAIDGDVARVEVEDSGIGINAERRKELFMPFQRVHQGGNALRPGTGLGLAISRRLVEAMGGLIGLESEPGVGSRFWFSVPLASPQVVAAECASAAANGAMVD